MEEVEKIRQYIAMLEAAGEYECAEALRFDLEEMEEQQ